MNLPTKTATRSLKCKSTWLTVEVWETSEVTQIPWHNGTYYGIFCEFKIIGGERESLRVGVGPDVYTHLSVDESKLLLAWIIRAAVVGTLCLYPPHSRGTNRSGVSAAPPGPARRADPKNVGIRDLLSVSVTWVAGAG